MKVYKVELIIDTGYEIFCKICILYAQDKEDAKEKAYKYINSHLHGETFADVKKCNRNTHKRKWSYLSKLF